MNLYAVLWEFSGFCGVSGVFSETLSPCHGTYVFVLYVSGTSLVQT